jgi:putative ABC transport system ATP-binding protein
VLQGVDLSVATGQIVVLLGRSGSGKSTLLNLVSGIDQPTSGTVRVDGVDVAAQSETARTRLRRRRIGFIFQFFNLIATLTVEENLRLPLELNGVEGAAGRGRALDLLGEVGLGDRAASFPDRLSGGEQQRVAVARALVHDPALVLADEPTGNLDAESARQVLSLLTGLARRAGKTVIVASHSDEVAALADRVLTLADGRLVERTAR